MNAADPIPLFLAHQGVLVLDGGLATELEARGHDLSDALWSAGLLADDPDAIRQVHLDYFRAGADCAISASYQASVVGFARRGLGAAVARALLRRSVALALEAREEFWSDPIARTGRLRPLVAASVGPYGAALADGSEYTGRYDLDEPALRDFHRERWGELAAAGADLLACETLPSAIEARALLRLLDDHPGVRAWFSFSCRDERRISDGSPLVEAIAPLAEHPRIVAVGINCTPPRFIPALIAEARRAARKPIVVYPNSGEAWDATARVWRGQSDPVDFGLAARAWCAAGATLIGGCCRTGPEHVRQLRRQLLAEDRPPSTPAEASSPQEE